MAEAPPNLRYADGEHDCSNCWAFKPNSQTCAMFHDYPVSPDLVCDAWESEDSDPVKTDGSEA